MSTTVHPSLVEIGPHTMRPTALPDHIYAVLKGRILRCELLPEARLVEKNVCEELRVSRTPLREALNRLGHEGLVSFQPHAGYRVSAITLEGFRQLTEFRSIVEPEAAALAAQRATPEEIAHMRDKATLSFDPGDDRSFAEYCRANAHFHLAVVRSAHNAMLENAVMSALDMSQRPAYLRIGRQLDAAIPSAKHHGIVDAIERRDAAEARLLTHRHVLGSGDRILAALKAANYK